MQERNLSIQQAQIQALKDVRTFENKLLQQNSTDQTLCQEIVYESNRSSSDWLLDLKKEMLYLPGSNKALVQDIKQKRYYRSFDHQGAILAMEITSDGKTLITAGNHIKIWNLETGKLKLQITSKPWKIKSMILSSDNRFLLTNDSFYGFTLWDIQSGKQIISKPAIIPLSTENGRCFAISPDNSRIAISSKNTIEIIDFQTGKLLEKKNIDFFAGISNPIVFHPNGQTLICSSFMHPEICILDQQLNLIWKSSIGESRFGTTKLRIDPSGENLIVINNYTCLRLWNLSQKTWKGIDGDWADARFTNDEQCFYAHGHNTNIKVWDLETAQLLRTIELGSLNSPYDLAHRPNSNSIIQSLPDKSFRFCQLDSATLSQKYTAAHQYFIRYEFSPSGRYFISSDSLVIRIWDYAQKKCIRKFSTHWINQFRTFSPKENLIAYSVTNDVFVRELQSGSLIFELNGIKDLKGLSFDKTEKILFTAEGTEDRRIRGWNIATSTCCCNFTLGRWSESTNNTNTIRFSDRILFDSKNNRCITSDEDLRLRLWDLSNGKCISTFSAHRAKPRAMEFHPNEQFFVSADEENHILIWDLQTGNQIGEIKDYPPYTYSNWVLSVHFSSDGKVVFLYNQDKNIRFHDFQTGELLGCLNTLNDGWLWTTPSDKYAENGWIYTNRLDLVSFTAFRKDHPDDVEYLSDDDERVVNFLRLYNDKEMVLTRIFDQQRYLELAETRNNTKLTCKKMLSKEIEIKLLRADNRSH